MEDACDAAAVRWGYAERMSGTGRRDGGHAVWSLCVDVLMENGNIQSSMCLHVVNASLEH